MVLRADVGTPGRFGPSQMIRGAEAVVAQAMRFAPLSRHARPVVVNGAPGALVVQDGEPLALAAMTIQGGRITEIDILADPVRLARLDLTEVLDR